MANNSADPYQIAPTVEQLKQLKTWAQRATALGKAAEYLAALKAIHHHLTTDPLTWGDPWCRLS
jgi:hypothetical protein